MAGGHSLRGSGLGARSLEDEEGVEFAERQQIGFDCSNRHHFELAFSTEAELPLEWECPRCGQTAVRSDGTRLAEKQERPPRTHWDMLLERRSKEELEVLLQERLDEIRFEQF